MNKARVYNRLSLALLIRILPDSQSTNRVTFVVGIPQPAL